MATLHVRQFPDSLHHLLEKRADNDHRSLSAEVIVLLERELKKPLQDQEKVLHALERWRFKPSKKIPSSLELLRADQRR